MLKDTLTTHLQLLKSEANLRKSRFAPLFLGGKPTLINSDQTRRPMRITPARDPMKTTPAREGDLPGSCYSKLHLLRMPAQQPPFAVRGRIRPVFGALRRAWCGASLAGLNRQRVARDVASLWVPQEGKEKRVLQTNGDLERCAVCECTGHDHSNSYVTRPEMAQKE